MQQRIALYFQDKHPVAYELEMARYAEERGITEIWQADTRLARDCVVMMGALLAETRTTLATSIGRSALPLGDTVLPKDNLDPDVASRRNSRSGPSRSTR